MAKKAQSGGDFVELFRGSAPYIHAHRGRTFVVAFGGEAVVGDRFPSLIHDLALLHGLGIRLVLVHGARPQIEQRLRARGAELRLENGLRVTDDAALACVKEAIGTLRVEIEGLLSMGLANSPMAGARLRVASGNFITARPLGVIDGVDYHYTGKVRRVDAEAIRERLDAGAITLMPALGYASSGEVFNLSGAEVAGEVAVALGADKLIFLTEKPVRGMDEAALLPRDIDRLLGGRRKLSEDQARILGTAADACRRGVRRVHLLDRRQDGMLLRELFTRDGAGALIDAEPYENTRTARLDDVPGLLELISPLEDQGVLVRRSRDQLESEIKHFAVVERDGAIIACAALYPFPEHDSAELACVVVHPQYRTGGRGDVLLARMEEQAKAQDLKQLFVLTTQTSHWFRERGFEPMDVSKLPQRKRDLYNYQRKSKLLVKDL